MTFFKIRFCSQIDLDLDPDSTTSNKKLSKPLKFTKHKLHNLLKRSSDKFNIFLLLN